MLPDASAKPSGLYKYNFEYHAAAEAVRRRRAELRGPKRQESAGWRDLLALAFNACCIVTEEMPVSPEADWLQVVFRALQLLRS